MKGSSSWLLRGTPPSPPAHSQMGKDAQQLLPPLRQAGEGVFSVAAQETSEVVTVLAACSRTGF